MRVLWLCILCGSTAVTVGWALYVVHLRRKYGKVPPYLSGVTTRSVPLIPLSVANLMGFESLLGLLALGLFLALVVLEAVQHRRARRVSRAR